MTGGVLFTVSDLLRLPQTTGSTAHDTRRGQVKGRDIASFYNLHAYLREDYQEGSNNIMLVT